MDNLAVIIGIIGGVLSSIVAVTVILGWWLRGKLSDIVTALGILNNTVNHFIQGQASLLESQERAELYAQKTRERLIIVESKVDSAHSRIDNLVKKDNK